jgi:chorismate synthase
MTAGESHGEELIGILEGIPAGLPLSPDDIDGYLWRRQGGVGRGARMNIERDRVRIVSGLWKGETTGAPIGMSITNRGQIADDKQPPRTVPRPGHADMTGMLKYGFDDANPAIERASARETAMRVALGAVAHTFLREFDIAVFGHVVVVGGVHASPNRSDWGELVAERDRSPLYCADRSVEQEMLSRIEAARERQETLGGVAEVVALGVPPGLGSYAQWDRRLEASLARAILSIQSVKATSIGDGTETPLDFGRDAQDELGEETECRYIRSDTLVVPAGSVVAEAMVALTIVEAMLDKLGGDRLDDTRSAFDRYVERIPWRAPVLPDPLSAAPAPPPEPVEAPAEEV